MLDITGIDKAEILAGLFNGSKQQGMGLLDRRGENNLTVPQAREILEEMVCFDYLYGRVLKIGLDSDELDPRLYDRDNGKGAAEKIINQLRFKGQI